MGMFGAYWRTAMAITEADQREFEQWEQDLPALQTTEEPAGLWYFSDLKDIYALGGKDHLNTFRKMVGRLALVGGLALTGGAAVAGVATLNSPAKPVFGPGVTADAMPTLDGTLTLKGIAGHNIVMPLDNSQGIGAKIEITHLPSPEELGMGGISNEESQATVYSSILADAEHAVATTKDAMYNHWKGWWEAGTAGSLALMGLVSAGYWGIGEAGRKNLAENFPKGKRQLALLGTCILFASIDPFDHAGTAAARAQPPSPIFANVPGLENAHLTGTYSDEIGSVIERIITTLKANDVMGKTLDQNYVHETKQHQLLTASPGTQVMMVAANAHCNFSMNKLMRHVAQDSDSNIAAFTSDMVIGGIEFVDKACLGSLDYYMKGLAVVDVEGNHTDPGIAKYLRQLGWIVPDGHTVDVRGWEVIGISDSGLSLIGQKTDDTSAAAANTAAAARLTETACSSGEKPDIIMVPTPDMAYQALLQNCAELGIAGNRQEKLSWVMSNNGLLLPLEEGSNIGGVENDKVTLGASLNAPATLVLIKGSLGSFEPVALQVETFYPDLHVELGPIVDLRHDQELESANTSHAR